MRKTLLKFIMGIVAASVIVLTACDDIFEKDITDMTVAAITPSDGADIAEGEVTFCWNVLEGAERYRLTVVTPSFAEAAMLVCDEVITPDSAALSCSLAVNLPKGNYQWTLRGVNQTSISKEVVYDLSVFDPAEGPEEPEEPESPQEPEEPQEPEGPETPQDE